MARNLLSQWQVTGEVQRVSDQPQSVDELARDIAAYLREHPEAADSVDGIAQWWLQRQRYRIAVDRVKEALHRLEEQGQVERTPNATGVAVYRARRTAGTSHSQGEE